MSKKDVMTAVYLQDKNRFADLINVYCFEGRSVIRPEDILEIDSTEIHIQKKQKNLYVSKKYRDLTRRVVCGTQFLIINVEDQSHVDYAMPIRVMGYDANRYEKQLVDRKQEHREKKRFDRSGISVWDFQRRQILTCNNAGSLFWKTLGWCQKFVGTVGYEYSFAGASRIHCRLSPLCA